MSIPELATGKHEVAVNAIEDETAAAAAERRRIALRTKITQSEFGTVAETMRAAGILNSGAVDNFLRGLTGSLNLKTLEQIAKPLRCLVSELTGDPTLTKMNVETKQLRGEINADALRKGYFTEHGGWTFIVMPDSRFAKSYYVRLDSTEMDEVYPRGTLLEVVDLADFPGDIPIGIGCRVIVASIDQRDQGFIRIGCREIASARNGNNAVRLIARSAAPVWRSREIVWPYPIRSVATVSQRGVTFEIKSVVVRSVLDEFAS